MTTHGNSAPLLTEEYLARAYRGVSRKFPSRLLRDFDLFSRKVLSPGWRRLTAREQQIGVEEARRAFLKQDRRVIGQRTISVLFDQLAARAAFHAGDPLAESRFLSRCLRTRSRTFDRASAYEEVVGALLAAKKRPAARRYWEAGLRYTKGRNEYAHAALRVFAAALSERPKLGRARD